jgi:hypothetical protein
MSIRRPASDIPRVADDRAGPGETSITVIIDVSAS